VAVAAGALAIDLDAVLGDTRPLWEAWLEDLARRSRVDVTGLPSDRGAAAAELDRRAGSWQPLLERFAADHAPVHLRPNPEANAALRGLHAAGVRLGAFTDAPAALASVAVAHLGVGRRLEAVETGTDALARLLTLLGPGAEVVRSRTVLLVQSDAWSRRSSATGSSTPSSSGSTA
jgi:phosphoglycolate phosphatase-like HAD superfamily hydrolase